MIRSHTVLLTAVAVYLISVVQCDQSGSIAQYAIGRSEAVSDKGLIDVPDDESSYDSTDIWKRKVEDESDEVGKDEFSLDDELYDPEESPEGEAESPEPSPESIEDSYEVNEKDIDDVLKAMPESKVRTASDDEDVDVDGHKDNVDESEMQTSVAKSNPLRIVRVIVASKTFAKVYRNFQLIGRVRKWRGAQEFVCAARKGDSITILSKGLTTKKGKYFGIAAMVRPGGKRWFMTGGRGRRAFKAISLRTVIRLKKADLRKPRQKMCYLRFPYTITHQRRGRYATNKVAKRLFKAGGKYVWARKARVTDVIGVRFMVGGDGCNKPKPSKKPSASPSPKNVVGGARCACRVVRSRTKGECFEFRNAKFSGIPYKVGACRRRVCGLKYECVAPGRRSRILCLRRVARYEVRSVGPVFKGKCKNVPLKPVQPYYAPYS